LALVAKASSNAPSAQGGSVDAAQTHDQQGTMAVLDQTKGKRHWRCFHEEGKPKLEIPDRETQLQTRLTRLL
jgi:hypothetical protein